jgi:hypothetical protein
MLAVCLASPPAGAQDWYLLQGIFDAELYDTDTDSPLLSRNEGDLAALGRLQVWAALQLSPDLQFYVQGQVESDNFEGYGETTTDLDQVALRYTHEASPSLYIEAGKILSPLAAYSERRLSTRNPDRTAASTPRLSMGRQGGWVCRLVRLPGGVDRSIRQ